MKLRSELLDFERVTLKEWRVAERAVQKNSEKEVITSLGNQHRYELLDGGHNHFPEDVEERGYFEDDLRGIQFILEWLQDPTWETLLWASSMHCGGTFDNEALDKAVSEANQEWSE